MTEGKSPFNIDVGISAKAEITAEIPSSSIGRLVDTLTDAIRPFTEARGLRADMIRLQREEVAIEIAKRAQKRIAIQSRAARPVPLKTLVPLLEKGSLEDPSDDEMLDRWASLLAAETNPNTENQRWCIDILASIDAWQVQLLDAISRQSPRRDFFRLDRLTREAVGRLFADDIEIASSSKRQNAISIISQIPGYTLFFDGANIANTNEFEFKDIPETQALLHLEALGLIWINASSFILEDDMSFLLNAQLTPLGSNFVSVFAEEDE